MKNDLNKRLRLVFILFTITVMSLLVRVLYAYDFHQSALLYVGIPMLIAFWLILIRPESENLSWKRQYLHRLMSALIIMLGSSVVLFEGFLCVLMFLPIYLIVLLLVFAFDYIGHRRVGGTLNMTILPMLMLISSLEGVVEPLSMDRREQVSVTRVVNASIAEIKQNLQQPMNLQKDRPWFLYLFPMPVAIDSGSLVVGAVHDIHFRYYRWFVTNVHDGHMKLKIVAVEKNRIQTQIIEDTSYIANYLDFQGSEIIFRELSSHKTHVTLRVNFNRKLDPYWYFSPLERHGVRLTAEFVMTEVIANDKR